MPAVDLQTLDIKNLKLGKSGRAVKLLYDKQPLQLCTSTMYIPFGVKFSVKEWTNYPEYYLDCFLNNSKSDISINFKECIGRLDSMISDLVKQNLTLFNSKTESPRSDFDYSPILRENGQYPKLMRLQVSRDRNGNFESFIFDENKQKVPIDENNIESILCKGKTFKTIIECVKVWYYNGKVGSIWKIVQLKFSERTVSNEPEENNTGGNVYNSLMIDD
jgi:hypothetical protein